MLARWTLRTRLAIAVVAAVLPALLLAVLLALRNEAMAARAAEASTIAAAELASARHEQLLEASHRMLTALCADASVRASALPDASQADLSRCEGYLAEALGGYADQYSGAVVTDAAGTTRCASLAAARGISFSDRDVFRRVRESRRFAVGDQMASRVTPNAVIPIGLPVLQAGQFRGMCAMGVSLRAFADHVSPPGGDHAVPVALVDGEGTPIGGSAAATRSLPVPARIAEAIARRQPSFREVGQDGRSYDFHLVSLGSTSLYAIAAAPQAEALATLLGAWSVVAVVVLALLAALGAIWLGAERWCAQPLRYIRAFADRVARGEDIELEASRPWGPELASVGEGVRAMAAAIASREAELRAGLEQRDHMLREIHHRVKNNLQMISSLLNLQAGEIRSPRIRRFFGDAQNRVLTLSILHRHLYERSSWALVDFQQFISDLVRQISVGRRGPDRPPPRYHIRAPIMAVGPDTAIPIGLIVTEAVGSALNRARDSAATPEIRIEAAERDGRVDLTIEDNGPGFDRGIGPGARGGFGLTLIRGLAMQLGGESRISLRDEGGMRISVTFPTPLDPDDHG